MIGIKRFPTQFYKQDVVNNDKLELKEGQEVEKWIIISSKPCVLSPYETDVIKF